MESDNTKKPLDVLGIIDLEDHVNVEAAKKEDLELATNVMVQAEKMLADSLSLSTGMVVMAGLRRIAR